MLTFTFQTRQIKPKMNFANTKRILILQPQNNVKSDLENALKNSVYEFCCVHTIELSIEQIVTDTYDLIICKNQLDNKNGFEVYKILKPFLERSGMPFFLCDENFEKEDILIGLEMGIDNFIFSPIDKKALFFKIEKQINKYREINIFKTDGFVNYFYSSNVAMLYVRNDRIELVNESFIRMLENTKEEILQSTFTSLFDFEDNQQNKLNYRKFINGVYDSCLLKNIKSNYYTFLKFDVSLYRGNNGCMSSFFAEFVVVENPEKNFSNIDSQLNQTSKILADNPGSNGNGNASVHLTDREHEILDLSAEGLAIKNIAEHLNLSQRTVAKHRSNIMAKYNSKNIIEAILSFKKESMHF